ncbi:MAG: DUF418 domain-containing protein [Vicinamibacteria bacterium]
MTDTAPAQPSERIDVVDALRGAALAGVLMANLGPLSLYEFLTDAQKQALPTAAFDRVALALMHLLVDGKAITVFAMLFGVGFALQLDRGGARDGERVGIFLRRVAVLLAIGMVHAYFVWWGDILVWYAAVGALMVPVRRASNRVVLAIAAAIALVIPPLVFAQVRAFLAPPAQADVYAAALSAFTTGGYADIVRHNAALVDWSRRSNWALVGFVGGRFLLGYWAARRGLLRDPAAHRVLLTRIFTVSLALGIVLTFLQETQALWKAGVPFLAAGPGNLLMRMALRATTLTLGVAYGVGFLLLFQVERARGLLRLLAPVGRMALTNYLSQSVLGIAIFYGVGLGIGPRFGVAGWWTAWLAIFAAQVWASRVWLARYRYGPMEWLWRSLTYGALQPIRVAP